MKEAINIVKNNNTVKAVVTNAICRLEIILCSEFVLPLQFQEVFWNFKPFFPGSGKIWGISKFCWMDAVNDARERSRSC